MAIDDNKTKGRSNHEDKDFDLKEQIDNPWERLNQKDELGDTTTKQQEIKEEQDDFKSAFRDFKKTFIFKTLVVATIAAVIGGAIWAVYALTTMDFSIDKMDGEGSLKFYEENKGIIWTYVHISLFALVMLVFAIRDHVTFKKGQHLESKSIVVSLGIAGTFLGIFIGLQGFNVNDITNSVPELLNGLKLAFATSILGMFFTIPLTAMQQLPNVDSKAEMRTLIEMSQKLTSVECLPSMAKNMQASMETIHDMNANIKNELIDENSNRTNEILGQIAAKSTKTVDLLTTLEISIGKLAETNQQLVKLLSDGDVKINSAQSSRVSGSVPSIYE